MKVLKDIKISKDRIPVQNALWIRPMGGLSFKLYIPSGVDWKEVGIDNKPSPSPTPSGKRSNCEGGKVIIGKCIAKYPTVGDRYYFADGIVKFKKSLRPNGQWTIMRHDAMYDQPLDEVPSTPDNLFKTNRHFPIVVTITKAGLSCMENVKVSKISKTPVHHGGKPVYKYATDIVHLTCDTTSPYFKIINGQIRHIIPESLGYFEVQIRKMRYQPRRNRRGHQIQPNNSGWALLRLKGRVQSKTRKPSAHVQSLNPRQIVKLTGRSLETIDNRLAKDTAFAKKAILIKKVSKRRVSNAIRGYFLGLKNPQRPSVEYCAKVTTFNKRV